MDAAIEQWINSLPLAAETKAAMIGDAAFENVYKDNVLTRSDYSRQSNELKTLQQEAETARSTANRLIEENTTWKGEEQERMNAAITRAQAAEQRLLTLQQKLRDEYQAYPETIKDLKLDEDPLTKLPSLEKPGPKYIQFTEEQLQQRELGNLGIAAQLAKLGREHSSLFGSYGDFDEQELVTYALQNKSPSLQAAWEQKYKVSDKREAIRLADVERQKTEAVTVARAKWESEQALREQRNLDSLSHMPSVGEGYDHFKHVLNSERPINNDVRNEGAEKRARIDRALATSAKVRSGEIPVIPITTG